MAKDPTRNKSRKSSPKKPSSQKGAEEQGKALPNGHKQVKKGRTEAPRRRRVTEKSDKDDNIRLQDVRVKTARGRKMSSTLWLRRQLNDPYVMQARAKGYRSRAAFKFIELDDKFELMKPGSLIADLGAAPGGWTQIAMSRGASKVVGIDLIYVEPIGGLDFVQMDFMAPEAPATLIKMLGSKPDLVMSDLAANTTGHRKTDHIRTVALVDAAADFAMDTLKTGGNFVTKVFQGGTEEQLLLKLKKSFKSVRHAKPDSSRDGSPEVYLVALGFKGRSD